MFVKEHVSPMQTVAAWQIVIMVDSPKEYQGLMATDTIPLRIDQPESFKDATAKLFTYGLSTTEMVEGSVPNLLKGRRIVFDYRSTKPTKGRLLPEITIIKVLSTVDKEQSN